MYKDQPQSYVYDLLDELMWPGQPLGEPVIGTSASVSALDREEISAFKNDYYCPSNIVVSAAGALSHDALAKKIEKIFSHRNSGNKSSFKKAEESQAKAQLKVFNKATEQTHMALGFHSLEREHTLKYALALLHIILGANMSSRLFNELREKRGLAYEIGTGVKRYEDTGAFIVHAGIDNTKVVQALSIILGELKKIAQELVTQDEFKRAKDFYLGQLMLALEDTLDHMLWIGETAAALSRIYTIKDIVKGVSKVTRADIRTAAQKIFREEKLSVSLIGPLENSEGSIRECLRLN
jgi:predicted Zn-dependent peptidase